VNSDAQASAQEARASIVQLITHVKGDPGSFAWLGLVSPTKPELSLITELFGLEPLDVEDAANVSQRAKFDLSEGKGFALLKTLSYDEVSREITTGQTSVFVGDWFAITVRYGEAGDLTNVRERISHSERLRTHGPLAVLYAVLDITVDAYLAVVVEVHDDMREIEQDVFSMQPTPETTKNIYHLKRENIAVSQAVSPLVYAAQRFAAATYESIPTQLGTVLCRHRRTYSSGKRHGGKHRQCVAHHAHGVNRATGLQTKHRYAKDFCLGCNRGGPNLDRGDLRYEL